jgi:hypothetical protein
LYEQVVKPTPAKGGGAEAVAPEDVASTLTGFCSAAFDGSSASDVLQNNEKEYKSTSTPMLYSAEADKISSEVYYHQRA